MAEPKKSRSSDPKENEKGRFSDTMNRLKKGETIHELSDYARANKFDTISYIILIVGIIFLFFDAWIGGALIGVIFGIYFAQEVIDFFSSIQFFVEEHGVVRTFVLGAVILGAVILCPAFFIAAAIGVGVKELFVIITRKKKG